MSKKKDVFVSKEKLVVQSDMEDITEWLTETDIETEEELLKLVDNYNACME